MQLSGRNIYYMNGADAAGGGGGSVDESKVIVKSATIPAASSDNVGKMYIYAGETNATYTHGYIYECKGTYTYTSTVDFTNASLSGTSVSCSGSDFAAFALEAVGADPRAIVSGTLTYLGDSSALWVFVGKNASNETVATYQVYQEDYEEAGFTFTGTPVENDVITFSCNITESSATYTWERIDVQPSATIPTPATYWYTGNTGTTITIVDTTDADCVEVFRNGILQKQGVAYTVSGTTLTLTDAVDTTDEIAVKVNDLSSADFQAIEALLHNVNSGTN